MSTRRVTNWVAKWSDLDPVEGDLIEFDRTYYSHWAMYIGTVLGKDRQIVHFNPDGNEAVKPTQGHKFIPGKVTYAALGEIAGSSRIRVNNKPEVTASVRSIEHIRGTRKVLVNKTGFYYSLDFFNCEHFATYIKFEGFAESSQLNTIQGILTGGLTKLQIGGGNREALFNKVAYQQWARNAYFGYRNRQPPRVLELFISFWEAPSHVEHEYEKRYNDAMSMK